MGRGCGSLARQHGWGSLAGRLVLTAGLGEMGGAQAQAITFNGGVGLLVDVDPEQTWLTPLLSSEKPGDLPEPPQSKEPDAVEPPQERDAKAPGA